MSTETPTLPGFIRVTEAARQSGLSAWMLTRLSRDGELPPLTRIDGELSFPAAGLREAFLEMMERHAVKPSDERFHANPSSTEVRSRCMSRHGQSDEFLDAMRQLRASAPNSIRSGWIYASVSVDGSLLKVGGTSVCAWCRQAGHGNADLKAIAFSPNWRIGEEVILEAMGEPSRGREWFRRPSTRLAWLIAEGLISKVGVTPIAIVGRPAARIFG